MRPRISIIGRVRPLVGRLVGYAFINIANLYLPIYPLKAFYLPTVLKTLIITDTIKIQEWFQ